MTLPIWATHRRGFWATFSHNQHTRSDRRHSHSATLVSTRQTVTNTAQKLLARAVIKSVSESELDSARSAARALTELSPTSAAAVLRTCAPATVVTLFALEPSLARSPRFAAQAASNGSQPCADPIQAFVCEHWVDASTAWLANRWAAQQAFEESEALGLFSDAEEFPAALRDELPEEAPSGLTPEQRGLWDDALPAKIGRLLASVGEATVAPSPPSSPAAEPPRAAAATRAGKEPPRRARSVGALTLADLWTGSSRPHGPDLWEDLWAGSCDHDVPSRSQEERDEGTAELTAGAGSALLGLLLSCGETLKLRRLEALDLSAARLGGPSACAGLLRKLALRCSGLSQLWLRGQPLISACLAGIGSGLASLELLALGGCTGVDDTALLALLEAASHHSMVEHTVRRRLPPSSSPRIDFGSPPKPADEERVLVAPSLTHLEVRNCFGLTDVAFDAIATRLGGLQDLSAYGCRRLTDKGLAAMSGLGCTNLRWCNLSGAYKVSEAAMQCLLGAHPSLLVYNRADKFGVAEHGMAEPGE